MQKSSYTSQIPWSHPPSCFLETSVFLVPSSPPIFFFCKLKVYKLFLALLLMTIIILTFVSSFIKLKKWSWIYSFLLWNMRKSVQSYFISSFPCLFYFLIFIYTWCSVPVHYDHVIIILHCIIVLFFLNHFNNLEMYHILECIKYI